MKSSQYHTMTASGIYRPPQSSLFQATSLDIESAKNIARKIFDLYDVNKTGVIESQECRSMICDAYLSVNRNFTPSEDEAHDYLKIQDRDHDGKLTLADLERSCIQYLCGRGGSGVSLGLERPTATMTKYNPGTSTIRAPVLTTTTAQPVEAVITKTTTTTTEVQKR